MKPRTAVGLLVIASASLGCADQIENTSGERVVAPNLSTLSGPTTMTFEAVWSGWIGRSAGLEEFTCDPNHYGSPVIPTAECPYLQFGRWEDTDQGRTFIAVDFNTHGIPDCAVISNTWLEFSCVDVIEKHFTSQPPSPLGCLECVSGGVDPQCGAADGWTNISGSLQVGVASAAVAESGCVSTPPVPCIVTECGPYGIQGGLWATPSPISAGQLVTIDPTRTHFANPQGYTRYVVDHEEGEIQDNQYRVFMLESDLIGSVKPKLYVTYTVPCPEVVVTTMQGSVTTNPNPSLMNLHFGFNSSCAPTKFEIQYLLPGGSWTTFTCNSPSASCVFNGVATQGTTAVSCLAGTIKWKARAFDGCWGAWSSVKTFTTDCVE